MTTRTGSGSSNIPDSRAAGADAAKKARAGCDSIPPSFGLIFAGPDHDLAAVLAGANEGGDAQFMGCSTAGEFTEDGLTHGAVAAFLVASDETSYEASYGVGMKDGAEAVAEALCSQFDDLRAKSAGVGRLRPTSILLTDGLAGTGEVALKALRRHVGPFQQIAGGAAGDEGRFEATGVGLGSQASNDAAAVLHLFGRKPWGIGVGHGLQPASERMLVTRAEGNVVHEIDGQPAFETYRKHAAGNGVELTPEGAGSYMIGNELGVFTFDRISKARAPLAVGDDGSLSCAADIPTGASICILDGKPDNMIDAARQAAEEAKEHLEGSEAAGVLIFDCVCRGMILDEDFQREIDAVRGVFGEVPVAGFLTYGEIARYKGLLDGWHNSTAVVLAVPN